MKKLILIFALLVNVSVSVQTWRADARDEAAYSTGAIRLITTDRRPWRRSRCDWPTSGLV